jgi:ribonuclease P protein component
MVGSKRAGIWPLLAANDEKDLSTAQPPPLTDARIHGSHGHAGRKKYTQAPPRQGAPAPDHNDSSQAARVDRRRPATLGFGRADRLRKAGEFIQLQRRGARYQSGHFVLYGLGGAKDEPSRLGITVSRRVGNAVVRNRLKRRVRECYRLKLRAMLPAGVAMVVIARKGAGDLEWATIDAELIAGAVALGHKLLADPGIERKTRIETGPESKTKAPTKPSTKPSSRTNLRERDRP